MLLTVQGKRTPPYTTIIKYIIFNIRYPFWDVYSRYLLII